MWFGPTRVGWRPATAPTYQNPSDRVPLYRFQVKLASETRLVGDEGIALLKLERLNNQIVLAYPTANQVARQRTIPRAGRCVQHRVFPYAQVYAGAVPAERTRRSDNGRGPHKVHHPPAKIVIVARFGGNRLDYMA